jgi:transketolase
MEDIGVATALPNMSVIAPCDPSEVEAATRWCATQTQGPVYLRLGKAGEPELTDGADEPWAFGKLRAIQRSGNDVAVISYGPVAKKAIQLAERIRQRGEAVSVYSCHTVKPLDVERLAEVLQNYKRVIVVEETTPNGSVGRRVKEIAWDTAARCRIDCFSLQDRFIHCYGSHDDLLAAHGIDVNQMYAILGYA